MWKKHTLVMLVTWSTNVNPLSTTPRSRTQLDGWMEAPCSYRGSVVHCCRRRDVPSNITSVLVESEPVGGHPCLDRNDTVSHVSHQLSRLWRISMAVYLKVVSVRVHTESSVLNKLDEIWKEQDPGRTLVERHSSQASRETFRRYSEQTKNVQFSSLSCQTYYVA